MEIAFYLAAAIAIYATVRVITNTNPVHALLSLIVSLLAVAMIFFMLGAPFAGALEVIVYAGAIMVLFVFVVMMLMIPPTPSASYFDDGFVITSMSLIVLAGRLFRTSLKFFDIMVELLPFTNTLKFDCPLSVIFSSASTLINGTLRNISNEFVVCASGSASML